MLKRNSSENNQMIKVYKQNNQIRIKQTHFPQLEKANLGTQLAKT